MFFVRTSCWNLKDYWVCHSLMWNKGKALPQWINFSPHTDWIKFTQVGNYFWIEARIAVLTHTTQKLSYQKWRSGSFQSQSSSNRTVNLPFLKCALGHLDFWKIMVKNHILKIHVYNYQNNTSSLIIVLISMLNCPGTYLMWKMVYKPEIFCATWKIYCHQPSYW